MILQTRDDIWKMANLIGLRKTAVEVGVLRGHYSKRILEHWGGKKLYLIDAWRSFPDTYADKNNYEDPENIANMALTVARVAPYGDRVTVIREESLSAAEMFPYDSLEVVYLDSDHSYEHVKKELLAWWPRIMYHGLLCGHDYLDSPKSENGMSDFGVKRAVDEFALELDLELTITTDDFKNPDYEDFEQSWVLRRKDD